MLTIYCMAFGLLSCIIIMIYDYQSAVLFILQNYRPFQRSLELY